MTSELPDSDMVTDNGFTKNPMPAWLWLAVIVALAALLWGGGSWLFFKKEGLVEDSPFLQVTNRDFSLFLWQNPEYMRANVSSKTGYLPGFQYSDKVSIEPGQADKFVSAPPEVVFLYHVWDRLVRKEFSRRPVRISEFNDFLAYCKEWLPANWPQAPEQYKELMANLPKDSSALISQGLPSDVMRAFIGWKNFFMEGSKINTLIPTNGEMAQFLSLFPHYARNYWRNIVSKGHPNYLLSLKAEDYDPNSPIPEDEVPGFLKVAFFNYMQAKANL